MTGRTGTNEDGSAAGRPAFADLYRMLPPSGSSVTPRMAYWLWSTAISMADTWRDNAEDPEPLHEWLPPIARAVAHGPWLDRFIDCFDAIAGKLAAAEIDTDGIASCTGEEMALHLVIDLAEAHLADGVLDADLPGVAALPDYGPRDEDFDSMRTDLFKDNDVLMLYDPRLDGIESRTPRTTSAGKSGSSTFIRLVYAVLARLTTGLSPPAGRRWLERLGLSGHKITSGAGAAERHSGPHTRLRVIDPPGRHEEALPRHRRLNPR